jgi:hypothetical protein
MMTRSRARTREGVSRAEAMVDAGLWEACRAEATRRGTSASELVRDALAGHLLACLERRLPEAATRPGDDAGRGHLTEAESVRVLDQIHGRLEDLDVDRARAILDEVEGLLAELAAMEGRRVILVGLAVDIEMSRRAAALGDEGGH